MPAAPLDVTDESSCGPPSRQIEREEGAVGALVNNAGYSLERRGREVPLEDARRQFETNVFGLCA